MLGVERCFGVAKDVALKSPILQHRSRAVKRAAAVASLRDKVDTMI